MEGYSDMIAMEVLSCVMYDASASPIEGSYVLYCSFDSTVCTSVSTSTYIFSHFVCNISVSQSDQDQDQGVSCCPVPRRCSTSPHKSIPKYTRPSTWYSTALSESLSGSTSSQLRYLVLSSQQSPVSVNLIAVPLSVQPVTLSEILIVLSLPHT
ncbi:uncharacterized protein RAG0_12469 [Rhynchosporium agropyri]|uniref:Uncharacterized protein n=1 Tax=Rhynchosporium agropyri TaxID=914238 RepID=A0A1E1L8Z4_9HELO|nr:uncharacterized protein RAG0_12469 [Rhynchosporium agropyri]